MERRAAFQQEGSGSECVEPAMDSGLGPAPVSHVTLIRNKQRTAEKKTRRNKRWRLLKTHMKNSLKKENHLFNAGVSAHTHQSGVTLIFSIYR